MAYESRTRTMADVLMGDYLAGCRLRRGLSQEQVAAHMHKMTGKRWSQARVSNVESGRAVVSVSQLCAMAVAVGASPARVLELATTSTGAASDIHPGPTQAWEIPRPVVEPSQTPRRSDL